MYKVKEMQKKCLLTMQNAICRNNLDKLRTLLSLQTCSDAQALRKTLLCFSVKHNKKVITEFLLQVGSNPNSGVHSSKPLHIAAGNGNLGIIEILLNHGADINAKDAVGTSPLVYAINNKKDDATELLLERGARLFSDSEGRSPLHNAAKTGSLKIIKMLLQNGAPVNAVITGGHRGFRKGYTPLHCACSLSRARVDINIIEFLLSNGAGVDLITEEGLTPLHVASQRGNVQVINLLLNHNSDIDGRENNGYTPLYLAINRGNEDAALMLIHRGAKLNDEFSNGKTILSLALEKRLSSTVEEILTRCPDPQGEIEKCEKIFESLSQDMINTLLKYCFYIEFFHIAIRKGYIQIIESVIKDHIAAVNLRDKNGKTALHIVAASKCDDSTKLLLENKANVNSQDNDGSTALHIAIDSKKEYVVQLLLKFGADINIKNRNNHTPIDILNHGRRYYEYYNDVYYPTLKHALTLEAINLYYANDSRSSFSKLFSSDQIKMESHFENCKQEIEKLKLVKVPGSQLTCYALMTRSIHSVASYVKNEDLITHFGSDDFTTKFRIYAPIIQGRLRNAFQRRPLICGAGDFFNYYFQLPHVCVDHILSCLSSDDLKNVMDAM